MSTPEEPYHYPFSLHSELDSVSLGNDLWLRALDEGTRRALLKIYNVEWDEEGRLKSYISSSFDQLMSPDLDRTIEFYSSNFVLSTGSTTLARDFNFALKLIGLSKSSLYIGYKGEAVAFQAPPCYFGRQRLRLDAAGVTELKEILDLVGRRAEDPKLSLMRDIWMYSMSDAPRQESRFVEVSTLLEMLLLPKQSPELAFRFALRVAKIAAKFGFGDPQDFFQQAKMFYAIRSKLVHGGTDTRLAQHELACYELARKLLRLYVADPAVFQDDYLDNLCIST